MSLGIVKNGENKIIAAHICDWEPYVAAKTVCSPSSRLATGENRTITFTDVPCGDDDNGAWYLVTLSIGGDDTTQRGSNLLFYNYSTFNGVGFGGGYASIGWSSYTWEPLIVQVKPTSAGEKRRTVTANININNGTSNSFSSGKLSAVRIA